MKKAKSRLKSSKKAVSPSGKTVSRTKNGFFQSCWSRYLKHLPTFVISLPFYGGVYFLVTKFYPHQLRHILLANTYLPLQLTFFAGNFFFFSFIFLNSRRGFLFSLWLSWFLFLKLQPITNYLTVSAVSLLILMVLELVFSLISQKNSRWGSWH